MSDEEYAALLVVWSTIKAEFHFQCETCGRPWVAFNAPRTVDRCHFCWPSEN